MSAVDNARAALAEAVVSVSDADRCVALHITPSTHTLHRRLRQAAEALHDLITEHERILAEREWEYMSVMVDDNTGDDWDEVLADSKEEAQRHIDERIAENGAPDVGTSLIIRRRLKPGPWLTDQADRSTT